MRKLCSFLLFFIFVQSLKAQDLQLYFDTKMPKPLPDTALPHGKNVELVFVGTAENVKSYFFHSQWLAANGTKGVLITDKLKSAKRLDTKEKFFTDHFKGDSLRLLLNQDVYGPENFSFLFSKAADGTFDTTRIVIKNEEEDAKATNEGRKAGGVFDEAIIASISGKGACQLCDEYAAKRQINSKKDRVYSTDYIVIYDPSLKKDAYTICRHVFEKEGNNLVERYIKVAPKWFAPGVGSQIRFEVVNVPLNKAMKLTVEEQDVFNGGASQFSSLITGLVTTNIVTPVSASTTASTTAIKHEAKGIDLLPALEDVAADLLRYMSAFRVSSCAIQQHYTNLPILMGNINKHVGTTAASADGLAIQLNKRIEKEIKEDDDKEKARQLVEAITNSLKGLENVQPIAYTTLRAKNRDYLEIRYSDANNLLSKPENIRLSGGMKIDFSAGFVLTGLRDYTYALKNVAVKYTPTGATGARDTTGNVIIKEEDGNNQVGVGILTHFYPRAFSHYNIGGTVGLMTSTNLNLRLMLGGSVMISSLFGSNNRVSFSGGIVWGKVKRLSAQSEDFFNHPRIINELPEFFSEASAPQPIDRNEHSWFFAVTFNFGGS